MRVIWRVGLLGLCFALTGNCSTWGCACSLTDDMNSLGYEGHQHLREQLRYLVPGGVVFIGMCSVGAFYLKQYLNEQLALKLAAEEKEKEWCQVEQPSFDG